MQVNSNYWDDDGSDDEFEGDSDQTKNPVREALKAKERKNKELVEKLAGLEATVAKLSEAHEKNTVKELITSRGLDAEVADFYGGEATPEALDQWLADKGKLFGYDPSSSPVEAPEGAVDGSTEPAGTGIPPEQQEALERMHQFKPPAGSGGLSDVDKLKEMASGATDQATLVSLFSAAQRA